VVVGQLTLTLGPFGGFARGLLVLLGFRRMRSSSRRFLAFCAETATSARIAIAMTTMTAINQIDMPLQYPPSDW
jgi:hypothetical protein